MTVPPAGGQLRLVASLIATNPSRRIRARPEADSRPDSEPECHGHTGSSSSLVVALATARRYHDGTVTVTVTAGPWLACIMFRPDWESSLAPSHALRRLWRRPAGQCRGRHVSDRGTGPGDSLLCSPQMSQVARTRAGHGHCRGKRVMVVPRGCASRGVG